MKKKINTLWKNITESIVFKMYYHRVQDTIQNYSKYEDPGIHKPHSREKTTESISQDNPDVGISTQGFWHPKMQGRICSWLKKKKKRKHRQRNINLKKEPNVNFRIERCNTIWNLKKSLEGLNRRMEMAEERVNELADR